jgi:hypothetical protein
VPTCGVGFPFGVGRGVKLIGILLGLVLQVNPIGHCVSQLTRQWCRIAKAAVFENGLASKGQFLSGLQCWPAIATLLALAGLISYQKKFQNQFGENTCFLFL